MIPAASLLRLVAWNVNGARARKAEILTLLTSLQTATPLWVLGLGETRCSEAQLTEMVQPACPQGTRVFVGAQAAQTGTHGSAVVVGPGFTVDRDSVVLDLPPGAAGSGEGRLVSLTLSAPGVPPFRLVHTYVMNAGVGKPALSNLHARVSSWDPALLAHMQLCKRQAGLGGRLVWMGDLNIVSNPALDTHSGRAVRYAGCTKDERTSFAGMCSVLSLVDVWRRQHGDERAYTFFSNRARGARARNKGWRLDYTMATQEFLDSVLRGSVHTAIASNDDPCTSDHMPISLTASTASS